MKKTTEKDFQIFIAECKKWIEILGLKGWKIYYTHETYENTLAWCSVGSLKDRCAKLGLSKNWGNFDKEINEDDIRKVAFHEVFELKLTRLRKLAKDRFITEYEIDEELHDIIRTIENVFYVFV